MITVKLKELVKVNGVGQNTINKIKDHFGGEVEIEIDESNESNDELLFESKFSGKIGKYSYKRIAVRRGQKKGRVLEGVLESCHQGRYIEFHLSENGKIGKSYTFHKINYENKLMRWIRRALEKAKENL